MNSIIKKNSLQVGLILSIVQILITIYLYFYSSFINMKFGMLIIVLNLVFGVLAIYINKKKLKNYITLKESFSGYFLTILVSMLVYSIFYIGFFEFAVPDAKKESIKKELFAYNVQNMRASKYSEEDIQKNIELSESSNPFGFATVFQSFTKKLILYSIAGLIISFVIKNKSSSHEISV